MTCTVPPSAKAASIPIPKDRLVQALRDNVRIGESLTPLSMSSASSDYPDHVASSVKLPASASMTHLAEALPLAVLSADATSIFCSGPGLPRLPGLPAQRLTPSSGHRPPVERRLPLTDPVLARRTFLYSQYLLKLVHLAIAGPIYLCITPGADAEAPVAPGSRGREFALNLCADCHVVASDQPQRPVHTQQIPSFAAIANRQGTTAESLWRFVKTTHSTMAEPGNMPIMGVTDYQLDEIIRYILSLRKKR